MTQETIDLISEHPDFIHAMLNVNKRRYSIKGSPIIKLSEDEPLSFYTQYGDIRYTLRELKMFVLVRDSKLGKMLYS